MEDGKVVWFNKHLGYGFVRIDRGQEVFTHYSVIDNSKKNLPQHYQDTKKYLKKGQLVGIEYRWNKERLALEATRAEVKQ